MSILDTFYILFKTNAQEAKQGMETAEGAAKKFDGTIGRTDQQVHAAGERMVETFKEVGTAIVAAFAVEKIREFILETVELNKALHDNSERIGVAVEDLAALQAGAKLFGGSADGVTQSLDFLNKGMADIAVKGKSRLSPFFDELGIKPLTAAGKVKPLLDIYRELADHLSKMSAQERSGISERFGIDQGLVLMLAQGRRGFDDIIERQKALGVTTQKDADIADAFGDTMDDVGVIMGHIGNVISSVILPPLTWLGQKVIAFVEYLSAHQGLVEGFFVGVGGVITAVYLPAVIRATVATFAFLAPYLLIGAAIAAVAAAFAFLYDDIKNFLEGNQSVVGELSKKWPIIGEVIHKVADFIVEAFHLAGDALQVFWDVSKGFFDFYVAAVTLFAAVIAAAGRLAGEAFDAIAAKVDEIWQKFATAFPTIAGIFRGFGTAVTAIIHSVGDAWEWLVGLVQKSVGWLVESFKLLPKALGKWAGDLGKVTAVVATVAAPAGAQAAPKPPAALAQGAPRTLPAGIQSPADLARGPATVPATRAAMEAGKAHIDAADRSPLAAHSPVSIAGPQETRIEKHTTVTVEKVEVHTQATDADGMGKAAAQALRGHLRQTVNHFDDGVKG